MKFPSVLMLLVAVIALLSSAAHGAPQPQPQPKLPSAATFKKIGDAVVSYLIIIKYYIQTIQKHTFFMFENSTIKTKASTYPI
jgi:hypothetical protein